YSVHNGTFAGPRSKQDGISEQHILGLGIKIFGGKGQFAVQEGRIHPDILLGECFPTKVLVGQVHLNGALLGVLVGTDGDRGEGIDHRNVIVRTDIPATQPAVRSPQLQVADPGDVKKILLTDTPCSGNRREITPFVIASESGGTVATDNRV